MPRTFVIIDGSSLVHRAFYALPLLMTANGQYTNAAYGFTTMLVKLLAEIKPEAIAVAFDKSRTTFRNDAYKEYKAHRRPTPAELSEQFPLVKEILSGFGITVLEEAGYEGDDIIGTLAGKASQEDYEVIIITGDRDALQLISPKVQVYLTKKGISDVEHFDTAAFQAKYSLMPLQLIDLKGLMGDTADNIPGVPGVGEKTAIKLIQEYGSVEEVLANIDNVSGKKLQEKLKENTKLALISKKLATIECAMPLEVSLANCGYTPDSQKLYELFSQCEFKSLLERFDQLFPGCKAAAKPAEAIPQAVILNDAAKIHKAAELIRKSGCMEFYMAAAKKVPELTLSGIAVVIEETPYFASRETLGFSELIGLIADSKIRKVTYDIKTVYSLCRQYNIKSQGQQFDILLAAYLLDPTAAAYPLESLAEKYLSRSFSPLASTVLPAEYAGQAVWLVHLLAGVLDEYLKQNKLDDLCCNMEVPLAEVLAVMEGHGIQIDVTYLKQLSADIGIQVGVLLQEIYKLAGEEFNVNSTKQLGVILFEKLGLPVQKKTKTGYSTDAEVLEKLAGKHPLINNLLEYRMLTKLKSTYLDGLEILVNKTTGRIHTTFNQTVTATGRLSSSEPNLQNIPVRTEIGKRIRELFVPGSGYDYIMSADYSQIELRILAHMSGDENLLDSFRHNEDVHTRTAAQVFGVPIAEVTSEMRSRAKAVNFGIVYGISDYGLSRDIGVSRKEAGFYIDSYFIKYQGVKNFLDQTVQDAHEKGYVTTLFGRRRYLPDINSKNFNQRSFAERVAMNTPIQGTAADVIKKAMLQVYKVLQEEKLKSRVLLQVHDELVLEVSKDEADKVSKLVKKAMEQAVDLRVPMTVEVKMGENWAAAK
ncbi:MAG: DNA polymerase I [Pelosinus sp.]|nr:DNA polymerase I [Pelosinus sp.]